MSGSMERIQIALCMGSSCYPRGNAENLQFVRHFIKVHGLESSVELVGHRCQGHCRQGPNMMVDEELHQDVSPVVLPALLRQLLPALKAGAKSGSAEGSE